MPAAPIVGRDDVLAEISAGLGLADAATAAVLLGGDAGIGKTRVVLEAAGRARAAGFRVLEGHCVDLGDNVPAFRPVAEVLADLPADEREQLVAAHPALAALSPGPEREVDEGSDDAAWLRADVFAAVARGLEQLATDQPLLLVLEDVHWADASTRHLVQYLLGRRFARPVALLVTFRSDDLHRRHPLRPAVAEWTRLPAVSRVDLAPLDDAAMTSLLRARDGRRISDDGVGTIIARAGGNAFYAEELLDAGLADGALPGDLADLLLVRFDRLGDDARAAARAVACAAGPVDDALLRHVVGPGVDDALREAVDRKVLATVGEAIGFRHALLAEAVRDDMLPGERRAMHARFLQALEAASGPVPAAATAFHAHGAGELGTAFEADLRAADHARRAGGHDEAAAHLQRALEVVEHATTDVDLTGLVTLTADALVAAGRLRTAASLLAVRLAETTDPQDRARLLYSAGHVAYLGSDDDAASLRALEAASAASEEVQARIESLRALVASGLGLDDEAVERAERAARLATEHGDEQTAAEAQMTLIRIAARAGSDDVGTAARYEEMAEAARRRGDVHGELRAWHHLAFLYLNAGDLETAEERFHVVMRRSRETGREWAPYGFDGRFFLALIAYLRGDWDRVLSLGEGLAGATRMARACLDAVGMLVLAARGRQPSPEALDAIRARWHFDQYPLALHSGTALIDLAPDVWSATAAHDEALAALSTLWLDPFAAYRLRTSGLLLGRLAAAVAASSAAEREQLRTLADEALEGAQTAAARLPGLGREGLAWLARVRAEHLRLRWLAGEEVSRGELVQAWTRATDDFVAFGEVYEAARSRTRLAQVLAGTGAGDAATEHAQQARAVAERLGATPLIAELDAVHRPESDDPVRSAVALTPREREVLTLVAEGRTNGEVAAQLFISTKTASVHVSNILGKLGASSRTEAAALARRDRLI